MDSVPSSSSSASLLGLAGRKRGGSGGGGECGATIQDTSPFLKDSDDLSDTDMTSEYSGTPRMGSVDLTPQDDFEDGQTPGPFVYLLTLTASIGGLLFGYDTGVISGVLVSLGRDITPEPLSDLQKEIITSATTLGALIGTFFAGPFADLAILGRKRVILLSNLLFILGALLQACCQGMVLMTTGRFILGLGVGVSSLVSPLYITELAPTKYRGRLIVFDVICITGGQVLAYAIGAGFANTPGGWRYMTGLGAVPAAIQLVLLIGLPESPRFLILNNQSAGARVILQKIYRSAHPDAVDRKIEEITRVVKIGRDMSLRRRLGNLVQVRSNVKALIVACGLQAIQQLSGFK